MPKNRQKGLKKCLFRSLIGLQANEYVRERLPK